MPYEHVFDEIIVPTIYVAIGIVGVIGNLMVITIIVNNQTLKRLTTNVLIANLAISDLMVIVLCIPPLFVGKIMKSGWSFGDIGCRVFAFTFDLLVLVSVYSLVLMSIDRYIAIVHYQRKQWRTLRNTYFSLLVIWSVAILVSITTIFTHKLKRTKSVEGANDNDTVAYCGHYDGMSGDLLAYIEGVYTFVVPFVIITILYFLIIRSLIKHKRNMAAGSVRNDGGTGSSPHHRVTQVSKTVFVVIITFVICWLPYCVFLFIRVS